jgi:hypothetical protein
MGSRVTGDGDPQRFVPVKGMATVRWRSVATEGRDRSSANGQNMAQAEGWCGLVRRPDRRFVGLGPSGRLKNGHGPVFLFSSNEHL